MVAARFFVASGEAALVPAAASLLIELFRRAAPHSRSGSSSWAPAARSRPRVHACRQCSARAWAARQLLRFRRGRRRPRLPALLLKRTTAARRSDASDGAIRATGAQRQWNFCREPRPWHHTVIGFVLSYIAFVSIALPAAGARAQPETRRRWRRRSACTGIVFGIPRLAGRRRPQRPPGAAPARGSRGFRGAADPALRLADGRLTASGRGLGGCSTSACARASSLPLATYGPRGDPGLTPTRCARLSPASHDAADQRVRDRDRQPGGRRGQRPHGRGRLGPCADLRCLATGISVIAAALSGMRWRAGCVAEAPWASPRRTDQRSGGEREPAKWQRTDPPGGGGTRDRRRTRPRRRDRHQRWPPRAPVICDIAPDAL